MQESNHEPEILAVIMCGLLACAGGIARELANFDNSFNIKRFFGNLFISSFSGVMIGLFLPDFEHKNWVLAAAGCAGLCGCAIVDYFAAIFKAVIQHVASQAVGHTIEVPKGRRKKK